MFDYQDQDQQQPCVNCHQHHEQMLMLSCIHDPCINCAATRYVENQPTNSKIYTCSKCGQETELDTSSVVELQRVYNQLKGRRKSQANKTPISNYSQPKNDYQHQLRAPRTRPYQTIKDSRRHQNTQYERPPQNPKYYAQPVSQPSYSSNPKKGGYQSDYPCPDHHEQELTYFCFSCHKPICPQCAIHGKHKDHEVETTRKAIKKIRALLHEDKQKLDQEASNLLSSKDEGKRKNKQWGEQSRKDQDYIKKKLTHLRNVLGEKQKQLLKSAQNNFQRNNDLIRQESSLGDKSLQEISLVKRNIDTTLKKQQLIILQQYNKREEEVISLLERIERQKQKAYDFQSKNPHKVLDLNQFDEQVNRILSDIHALKLATILKQ